MISASAWRNRWHSQRLSLCQCPEKSHSYIPIPFPGTAPNQLSPCLYFRDALTAWTLWSLQLRNNLKCKMWFGEAGKGGGTEPRPELSAGKGTKTPTLKSPIAHLPTWQKTEELKISPSNSEKHLYSLTHLFKTFTNLIKNELDLCGENGGHEWKLTQLNGQDAKVPAWPPPPSSTSVQCSGKQSNSEHINAILSVLSEQKPWVFVLRLKLVCPHLFQQWTPLSMAFGATSLQLGFPWHLLRQRCPPCPTKSSSGHTSRTSRGVPYGHANQQKGRAKTLKLSQRHNQGTPTRPHRHGLLPMDPTKSITLQKTSHDIISFHLYFILGQQMEASGFPGGQAATAGKVSREATEPAPLTVAHLFENRKYVNN